MTPAVDAARKAGIEFTVHEYEHDPNAESYGLEAAEKLGVEPDRVFKTLVVSPDGRELIVGIVPVNQQLDLKLMAKACGTKKIAMADRTRVERTTGYVLGGVSPIGQKKPLRTIVDELASICDTVYVSAGRRGLEIELAPDDLCRLTDGEFAPIAR